MSFEKDSFEQDFETEEHQTVFEVGKDLFYRNMNPDAVEIELLVEWHFNREVVKAVMPALIRWRDATLHGELGYRMWLKLVTSAPTRKGPLVLLLVAATVLFTLFAAVLVIGLFSSVNYSIRDLAWPVSIAGFLFFCIAGWAVYLLQRGQRALLGRPDELESLSEPDMTPDTKYTPWKES